MFDALCGSNDPISLLDSRQYYLPALFAAMNGAQRSIRIVIVLLVSICGSPKRLAYCITHTLIGDRAICSLLGIKGLAYHHARGRS
jgi:hypothetical protein